MKVIDIARTEKTPEIILDDAGRFLQIKGKCLPENIRDFSQNIIEKLEKYMEQLKPEPERSNGSGDFSVYFKLGYFNSAAAKFIADVLLVVDEYLQKGLNIKIYWYFEEEDTDMLEAGQDISKMVNVPMEYVAVRNK
jgi:hypothetical protein